MNVPQPEPVETEKPINEAEPVVEEATASPFDGLVTVGNNYPIGGVWCRVAKIQGPHIILTATEYTTKIKRFINNANKARKRRVSSSG